MITKAKPIVFAILVASALVAFYALALAAPKAGGDPAAEPTAPVSTPKPKPCERVSAGRWNYLVTLERKLDGSSGTHRKVRSKVCKERYFKYRRHVQEVRRDCLRKTWVGHASHYGTGDGFLGGAMACGGTLTASTMGVAHKTIACGTQITFKYGSNVQTATVTDRGPFVAGREWDLTPALRNALGFGDVGAVTASYRNCWAR